MASIFSAPAQKSEIVQLLNKELKSEMEYESKQSSSQDTLSIVHPFSIDENDVLSFEIRTSRPNNGYQTTKQEVSLTAIKSINKDIAILIQAPGSVKTTTVNYVANNTATTETYIDDAMDVHMKAPNKEKFAKKIVSAFKKAGYNIKTDYWAD
ncbi:hypothetical protein [Flavobacterium mesophilum]|uniref:hypothetical protein n=1 Tax=Flavobacterium mesophilum TaxID=3143495 RepID=UPI0031D70F95